LVSAVGHLPHRPEDAAVDRIAEVLRPQELRLLDRPVVDHQGAKESLLDLDVGGERWRRLVVV
jgi:hypothetical protein